MRKTVLAISALCLFLVLVIGSSFAGGINFDNINTGGNYVQIPNGYAGLNWNNFDAIDATAPQYKFVGYGAGLKSHPNDAFNAGGTPADITSSTPFTLQDGFFTGAWNDGLNIDITGKLNGNTVFHMAFSVNSTSPTHQNFHWSGINELDFVSSGGIENPNYIRYGGGWQFVVDNLNISTSTVPEPGSLLLLGTGLLGAVGAIRRKMKL